MEEEKSIQNPERHKSQSKVKSLGWRVWWEGGLQIAGPLEEQDGLLLQSSNTNTVPAPGTFVQILQEGVLEVNLDGRHMALCGGSGFGAVLIGIRNIMNRNWSVQLQHINCQADNNTVDYVAKEGVNAAISTSWSPASSVSGCCRLPF